MLGEKGYLSVLGSGSEIIFLRTQRAHAYMSGYLVLLKMKLFCLRDQALKWTISIVSKSQLI